jgi:hypothetical protein
LSADIFYGSSLIHSNHIFRVKTSFFRLSNSIQQFQIVLHPDFLKVSFVCRCFFRFGELKAELPAFGLLPFGQLFWLGFGEFLFCFLLGFSGDLRTSFLFSLSPSPREYVCASLCVRVREFLNK